MLTPPRDLTRATNHELTRQAAAAQVAVRVAFNNPTMWLSSWDFVGAATLTYIFNRLAATTLPIIDAFLAGTIEHYTGYRPPDGGVDPTRYRPLGVSNVSAVAQATKDRVLRRVAAGADLTDAIAIEGRAWEGRAIAEPFRLQRDVIADVTTDPDNDLWRGWARVAEPGACQFCRMLASRGAVYTKATVGGAFHPRCRCHGEPVMDADARDRLKADGAAAWAATQRDSIPTTG